jgi:hypothetical protein
VAPAFVICDEYRPAQQYSGGSGLRRFLRLNIAGRQVYLFWPAQISYRVIAAFGPAIAEQRLLDPAISHCLLLSEAAEAHPILERQKRLETVVLLP